jgi:dephospho-CoA kinase
MNPAIVIVVSGRIASGKTAFADLLAQKLGIVRTGFGDEVKARARARGCAETREVLQEIGADLVKNQPAEFCRAVLTRGNFKSGSGLVVDGIRHAEILTLMRQLLAPQAVAHIHVESSNSVRQTRMDERKRDGEIVLSKADSHSTEVQVADTLRRLADVEIDGSHELNAMVDDCLLALRDFHELGHRG